MLFLGVDLAWGDSTATRPGNETGVVALDASGTVLDAGWTRGVEETVAWVRTAAGGRQDVRLFVDASLVVDNPGGQRLCETHVGQRYGRWKVSANTTNLASPRLAGVTLRQRLEAEGGEPDRRWSYDSGWDGPSSRGRTLSETYPYTTLVGVPALGYDGERPRYKRKPRGMRATAYRPMRAAACDDLLRRLDRLEDADPPLRLRTSSVTAELLDEPSPLADAAYKHREDLLDAALCAWTASLWHRHGFDACQILGPPPSEQGPRPATIIAPARSEQRR